MSANAASQRYQFLSDAFDGQGGFAPRVSYAYDNGTSGKRVPQLNGPSELTPYQRESAEKFAGRNAVAVYENHLRTACERFGAFLGRRKPQRSGTEAPLTQLMLNDADMRGSSLDGFMWGLSLQCKARGAMLVLIDLPAQDAPASMADQIARRAVPCLRAIAPETVTAYDLDDETGLMEYCAIATVEDVDGKIQPCTREYDAAGWRLKCGDKVVAEGAHPFGQCPVLVLTENGALFPQIGKYAQIADLSRRLFNARSELDEILRGQTFSLLTLQVTPEQSATFNAAETAATIGIHSMLVHQGIAPSFIAPDAGPAATYLLVIDQLERAIKRVSMDDATEQGAQAESGIARRLRFEALNADIATFAAQLQQLERRIWNLFHRALGTVNRVEVVYPTDYNLVDTVTELDILDAMMRTGFPHPVLSEKRRAVVAGEFDQSDDATKLALMQAIDEQTQEEPPPATSPATPPGQGGT